MLGAKPWRRTAARGTHATTTEKERTKQMNETALPNQEIITDPTKRHDFVMLFSVTMGNPNGDPDEDNAPRTDPETGHGLTSDVSIKRKLRDWVAAYGPELVDEDHRHRMGIFIAKRGVLNREIRKSYVEQGLAVGRKVDRSLEDGEVRTEVSRLSDAGALPEGFGYAPDPSEERGILSYTGELSPAELKKALDELGDDLSRPVRRVLESVARDAGRPEKSRQNVDTARSYMCEHYFDVRMLGAVMGTGLNAGQSTGPLQLNGSRSIDPVTILDWTLTRVAVTREEDAENESTIGQKYLIPYALYRSYNFYSPRKAADNGVDSTDLKLMWTGIQNMWEEDRSAARGWMSHCRTYIFSHDSQMGNAPAQKLFRLVKVRLGEDADVPREDEDYEITVDEGNRPPGVTLTVL